ncbi:hypothetical protein O181_085156 [Austropuccinia psidii MF-1]|uniref:Uncharacterized protein n=1 Tax=Austropuccinia psidii MF-1 TaxID=1389203 RepID=A0A9Q3IJH2_9BASI|nr:hypothetical protein [Austropuccinia psidii MF-1]
MIQSFCQSTQKVPWLFVIRQVSTFTTVHSQPKLDPQQGDQTQWKPSLEWEPELRRRQRIAKERGRRGTQFVDKLKISIQAGKGGDGGVSFHREKFVARGGPSGGNGGNGGSVYLRPSRDIQSLNRIPRILKAPVGQGGGGEWMNGKAGKDVIIDVPIGTVVKEIRSVKISEHKESIPGIRFKGRPPKAEDLVGEDPQVAKTRRAKLFVHYPDFEDTNQTNQALKQLEVDLLQELWQAERDRYRSVPLEIDCAQFYLEKSQTCAFTSNPDSTGQHTNPSQDYFLVAKGGQGGIGNSNFSGNQTTLPRFATRGKSGEIIQLELELKTLADIGLVGFPNSGKSTLIHTLTNSRAEIAPYAFTTLTPQIGTLIIFTDGTWDTDNQTGPIDHSPQPTAYHSAASAWALIRDRSMRSGATGQPRKAESVRLTIADCPGLLPKASENVGLGHAFLRHIERSKMLIVVVDLFAGVPDLLKRSSTSSWDESPERPCRDVEMLIAELEAYQRGLGGRVGVVVANKADLMTASPELQKLALVRLQLLEQYVALVSEHQVKNGIREEKDNTIMVLATSAKHRQKIDNLVKIIKDQADKVKSSSSTMATVVASASSNLESSMD